MGFSDFTLRKRMDGGYTVASSATSLVDIVPDSFRFFRDFLPAFMMERKSLKLSFGKPFFDELIGYRHRPFDQASIFEKIRVLDPTPDANLLTSVEAAMRTSVPALRDVPIAQRWAG